MYSIVLFAGVSSVELCAHRGGVRFCLRESHEGLLIVASQVLPQSKRYSVSSFFCSTVVFARSWRDLKEYSAADREDPRPQPIYLPTGLG